MPVGSALFTDVPIEVHHPIMTDACAFLIDALRRVAEGGDIHEAELDAAVPDPFALDHDEKNAWEELSHWVDDEDIRERDARYAALKRERMRDHLTKLNANGT